MSVGEYLLLVGSTYATGTMYCADVVFLIPDVADRPLDRLIGQYADPSTGEVPCLIRVTTDLEAPNISHTLLVRERDLRERTVGLVTVVSDGPVPWDLKDGKPPETLSISRQLEWRDEMFKGHLGETQVADKVREYADEYHGRTRDAEQLVGAGPPQHQGPGEPDWTANPLVKALGAEDREFLRMWREKEDSHVIRAKFDLLDVKAVGTWASRLRSFLGQDIVPYRLKRGNWGMFHLRID